jgi:hypothetical protein
LVARLVRDQEAAGSNPVAPTTAIKGTSNFGSPLFYSFDVLLTYLFIFAFSAAFNILRFGAYIY